MDLTHRERSEASPVDELAERLDREPTDREALWATFADRAAERGHFTRGGTTDGTAASFDVAGTAASEPGEAAGGPDDDAGATDAGGAVPLDPDGPEELASTDAAAEPTDDPFDPEDERLSVAAGRRVGDDEFVVPTDDYCTTCPHFGDPPAPSCGHQGAEIVQFEDIGHVRVRNCPVVAERRERDFLG